MDEIVLKYVGNGNWLGGVPQCDLTSAMIEAAGQHGYTRDSLIASGLYVLPESVKAERSARSKSHVE